MVDYFVYLLILLAFLNGIFLLGFFTVKYFFPLVLNELPHTDKKNVSVFFGFGLTVFLIVTAVFFSHGRTLFIIPIISGVVYFYFYNKFKYIKRSNIKLVNCLKISDLLVWNLVFLIVFSYFFLVFKLDVNVPFYDYLYLSKLATGLSNEGNANLFSIYYFWNPSHQYMLYHYTDLWILSFLNFLTKLSEVKLLIYVIYPGLTSIALLITSDILLIYIKKYVLIGAFAILFGLKLFFPTEGEFISLSHMYRGIPFLTFYKLMPIYIYILLFCFFYLQKFMKTAYLFLSFVPIVYPTTVPSIAFFAASLFLLMILSYKKTKTIDKSKLLGIIFISIPIIGILLFQKIFDSVQTSPIVFHFYSIKTYVVFLYELIFKIFFEHFIVLILALGFIIYKVYKREKIIFNELILLCVTGIIGSYLFVYSQSPFPDNNQIVSNISPVLVIVLFIYFLKFLKEKHIYSILVCSTIFGLYNISFGIKPDYKRFVNPVNQYSNSFIQKSYQILQENNEGNRSVTVGITPFCWYFNKDNSFHFVSMHPEIKPPIDITVLFKGDLSTYSKTYHNEEYPPYKYFKNSKLTTENIYKYLKLNNVNFLLVDSIQLIPEGLKKKMTCKLYNSKLKSGIYQLN